jgi:hypothetical protein
MNPDEDSIFRQSCSGCKVREQCVQYSLTQTFCANLWNL